MEAPDPPLNVYLSFTPEDLQKHCNMVTQALRREGYLPVGMQDYVAGGLRSLNYRLEQVRNCDIFIGLIAHSYGDIPAFEEVDTMQQLRGTVPGDTSFTEYEYRQALAANKKILMFLHDETAKWSPQKMDSQTGKGDGGRRIRAWREDMSRERSIQSVPLFAGRNDLVGKVIAAISPGSKTGQPSASANRTALPTRDNLPSPTYSKLVGRQAKLKEIQEAFLKSPLICLEGNDGIGKTSVAIAVGNAYLQQPADEQLPPYVVWVNASAEAGKNLRLDDVLNLIARVANYQSLAQVSLVEKPGKKKEIEGILGKQKILVIVDDYDRIENEELRQWLLGITFPSHALLVMRKVPEQLTLLACVHITLDELSAEETIEYINSQAILLDINELEKNSAAPEAIRELANYTKRNPGVIKLAMGTLKGLLQADRMQADRKFSETLESLTRPAGQHHPEEEQSTDKIEALHRKVWEDLTPEARTVLRSVPLFSSNNLVDREALLATCGLKKSDFNAAQEQLLARSLLKMDYETSKYTVDSFTRNFAQEELRKEPEFEVAARKRWSEFYRDFVMRRVIRAEPEALYWRSLVSNSMELLDSEWPAIVDVLHWADQHRKDQLFLTLVLLLMHYMDSRFLNKERILFAGKGVQAARRLRLPYEEAILRIDTLGWTYFEEDCPHKAYEEISLGLGLVKPLMATSQEAWELRQLGLAWQARVKMEIALSDRSRFESPILHKEAVHLIEKALCADCSPWTRYRIFKAAGDIAFKSEISLRQLGQDKDALDFYLQAETEVAKYGGEGGSYQIAPRIGLAYLRKNNLKQAGSYFDGLCQNQHIPIIGKLYGKYGKALIERHLGQIEEANQEIEKLRSELLRYTSSNQLLKLVTMFDKATSVPSPETTS